MKDLVSANDEILVSVIIPVYNTGLFLKKCLDSIVGQSFDKYEVLCINDMSTDDSKNIIEEYRDNYPFVYLYETGINSGQAEARNVGLKHARGKYISFVDADDYLNDKDALRILYENAEQSDASVVVFDAETEYEDEECLKFGEPSVVSERIKDGIYKGKDYFRLFVNSPVTYVAVWRQFWKRDYLLNTNLFFVNNTAPHEDLVFTFEAFLKVDTICRISLKLYKYRCRQNSSMTARNYRKRLKAYLGCYKEILRFINSYGCEEEIMEEICRYISLVRQSIIDMAVNLVKSGENIMDFCEGNIYDFSILMERFHYLNRWLTSQEYEALDKERKILILGCGKTGQDVASMLELFGIDHYSFAVTKPNIERKSNIYLFSKVEHIEDYVVIIGVSKQYQEEIYTVLDNYKPKRIICLS